jgi:hypothetical protein
MYCFLALAAFAAELLAATVLHLILALAGGTIMIAGCESMLMSRVQVQFAFLDDLPPNYYKRISAFAEFAAVALAATVVLYCLAQLAAVPILATIMALTAYEGMKMINTRVQVAQARAWEYISRLGNQAWVEHAQRLLVALTDKVKPSMRDDEQPSNDQRFTVFAVAAAIDTSYLFYFVIGCIMVILLTCVQVAPARTEEDERGRRNTAVGPFIAERSKRFQSKKTPPAGGSHRGIDVGLPGEERKKAEKTNGATAAPEQSRSREFWKALVDPVRAGGAVLLRVLARMA